MAQVLLDLGEYVVTDAGEVAVHWQRLIDQLKSGRGMSGLTALPSEHVEVYNRRRGKDEIPVLEINDEITGPPIESYAWNMAECYRKISLDSYLLAKLHQKFPAAEQVYMDRLTLETAMMQERHMEDFLRILIYIVDVFNAYGIVRGIGRGSACASLILYLIGIHMVDPVLYEIPITEFLR